VVYRLAELVNNEADFVAAMKNASALIPDGGTCPSAAMERALGVMMANGLRTRPYKAAVLITDGVFYDNPKPKVAEKGFEYCEF